MLADRFPTSISQKLYSAHSENALDPPFRRLIDSHCLGELRVWHVCLSSQRTGHGLDLGLQRPKRASQLVRSEQNGKLCV
jgi:hypothetical protein